MDYTEIGKHLGQKSSYVTVYDKKLLVKAPRQSNRTKYGVLNDKLPFTGWDVWNNYEVSCLLNNGAPVTALAKIVYSCQSEYIVESKSLKLYWNGFNVTKMGDTIQDCYNEMKIVAEKDLSDLLGVGVKVELFKQSNIVQPNQLYSDYTDIDSEVENIEGYISYKLNKQYLSLSKYWAIPRTVKIRSSILRSLCEITSQPDTGNIFIHYTGKCKLDNTNILKYIISHREHNQFHEPTTEQIYMDLWNAYFPDELAVFCLYNRRGSLDINAFRASHSYLIPSEIVTPSKYWNKTASQ